MNSYDEKQAQRKRRYQKLSLQYQENANSKIKRIDDRMRSAAKLEGKADYYAKKAESVGSGGISSYDHDAIQTLRLRIEKVKNSDSLPKTKYAEIQRLKARIKALENRSTQHFDYDWFALEANADENQVKFIFKEEPSTTTKQVMKNNTFKWSPTTKS